MCCYCAYDLDFPPNLPQDRTTFTVVLTSSSRHFRAFEYYLVFSRGPPAFAVVLTPCAFSFASSLLQVNRTFSSPYTHRLGATVVPIAFSLLPCLLRYCFAPFGDFLWISCGFPLRICLREIDHFGELYRTYSSAPSYPATLSHRVPYHRTLHRFACETSSTKRRLRTINLYLIERAHHPQNHPPPSSRGTKIIFPGVKRVCWRSPSNFILP